MARKIANITRTSRTVMIHSLCLAVRGIRTCRALLLCAGTHLQGIRYTKPANDENRFCIQVQLARIVRLGKVCCELHQQMSCVSQLGDSLCSATEECGNNGFYV